MMANFIKYIIQHIDLNNEFRQVEGGQNEIAFINKGAGTATVNGIEIATNESLSISANTGEIYGDVWNVNATGTRLLIIQKFYLV